MHGDRIQLTRAFTNLVRNAIQAVPAGTGRVAITLARAEHNAIAIRIADNGCGIAPEHLQQVFAYRFTTRRDRGGTGLGLFIARKIVDAHKGSLAMQSRPDHGTIVTVTLPLAPS